MAQVPVLLGIFVLGGANAAGPRLWFTKDDLPRLREVVQHKPEAAVWAELLRRADDYCSPGSRRYADSADLDSGESAKPQTLAHVFGRRLTEWMQVLGFCYQLTGDERYASHGVEILCAAASKLVVTDERIAASFAGARGDLMRGYAIGLDWFGERLTAE